MNLLQRIDSLEEEAQGYLRLEQVEAAVGQSLAPLVANGVLLVDYRQALDGSAVTLCRLNRHHPLVRELTTW